MANTLGQILNQLYDYVSTNGRRARELERATAANAELRRLPQGAHERAAELTRANAALDMPLAEPRRLRDAMRANGFVPNRIPYALPYTRA